MNDGIDLPGAPAPPPRLPAPDAARLSASPSTRVRAGVRARAHACVRVRAHVCVGRLVGGSVSRRMDVGVPARTCV